MYFNDAFMETVPPVLLIALIYLLILNLIGFFCMIIDKRRAIFHQWRIRESSLLLLALLGGSIGVLMGMLIFHHKTQKPKFFIGIPIILVLQLLIIYYSYSLF